MGTFKEYINEKKLVDIRDVSSDRKEISKLWANGLSYDGYDLYDLYMKNYKMLQDEGEEIMNDYTITTNFDSQEVYLGYSPKEDTFYSGWDCWITEEVENPDFDLYDEESEYEDEYTEENSNGNIIQSFKIKKGKIVDLESSTDLSGIFYNNKGSGYDILKKNHKDIVDIRLD